MQVPIQVAVVLPDDGLFDGSLGDPLLENSTGTSYGDSSWEAFYFLVAYGSLTYGLTFAAFPILYSYAKTEMWTPLKVKQIGLTQLCAIGAFIFFLHKLLLKLLPTDVSHAILPPHPVSCWFSDFWKIASIFIYTNSIFVKQYRSYVRYVARESLPATYIHLLISAVPYALLLVLPLWSEYDSDADDCTESSAAKYPLFAIMFLVMVLTAFSVNTLRDTCTYFPNFRGAVIEIVGMFVILLATAFEMWGEDLCDSDFTRIYISAFLLATVPPAAFWAALGMVLWKMYVGDLAYCRELERLCSPTSHLISANRESVGPHGSNQFADGPPLPSTVNSTAPATRIRPNYAKGDRGEFFETDRLAALIDSGDHEEVKRFVLETNLDLVHILDRDGLGPLHRAVQGGCDDLVAFLLEINCDPNIPARDGDRAIHFAARTGNIKIIEHLKEANADVNAVSHRGITPLSYAVLSRSPSAISFLLDRGALPGIPDQEAGGDSWEKVHITDAGRMKNYWKQPLTLAVELGLANVVPLLAKHADLNATCTHGLTCLMNAVALGYKGVAEALLNSGADIWRMSSRQKRNVLHYNAMHGSRSMFETLKEWFMKTDPPSSPPSSPKRAVIPRTPLVTSATIEDPRVEEGDTSGSGSGEASPACDLGSAPTSDGVPSDVSEQWAEQHNPGVLWAAPADPRQLLAVFLSMPDCAGRTPLHYAVLRGHLELAAMLTAQGSNPDVRDVRFPEKGYAGATPAEYIEHRLQNGQELPSSERARYHKVWAALQESEGPQGERI